MDAGLFQIHIYLKIQTVLLIQNNKLVFGKESHMSNIHGEAEKTSPLHY